MLFGYVIGDVIKSMLIAQLVYQAMLKIGRNDTYRLGRVQLNQDQ